MIGDILDWGIYLIGIIPARVYIYFRRPSLPTVHFYGGGARVRVFRVPLFLPLFITPLDSHLREILYDTNKYSNSLQSREILFLDLGLYPRGFIYTSAVHLYLRSIFTAPRVRVFRVPLFSPTLYHPFGFSSPRDLFYNDDHTPIILLKHFLLYYMIMSSTV